MTLLNPSFELGWGTLLGGNQIPIHWDLSWANVDTELQAPKAGNGDTQTLANCIPECVHKLTSQLPDDEQLGGKDALILDGDATYKLFGNNSFRVTLKQEFSTPTGSKCSIVVPVQVHGHYNPITGELYNIDTGAAYWRVITDGYPHPWNTFNDDFKDRTWLEVGYSWTSYGITTVEIEFECHTLGGISFFIDDIQFSIDDEPEPVECKGLPRVQYVRTYNLLPQDATVEQFQKVASVVFDDRETIGFSADDAGIGDLENKLVAVWWFSPESWESQDALFEFFDTYYPQAAVENIFEYIPVPPVDPPPVDPPPSDWTPHSYVPTGCKTSFHGLGDDGITSVQQQLMQRGAEMVTAKAVQDIGWLSIIKHSDSDCLTVGRFIDDGYGGGSLEGFASEQSALAQATSRMNALWPLFQPHTSYVDYWEVINEQDPDSPEGHANLAQFCIHCMDIAEQWGIKLALFSYSLGVPEPYEWDAIAATGVFERIAQGGHAISLHEYGEWPRDQISQLGRYRYVYETHILPRELDIPLFITEAGAHGYNPSEYSDDQLIQQMAAYDNEVAKDPYVAGVHLFTVGGFGSWPQYRDRWVTLYGRFVDYAVSVKDRQNV